RLASVKGKRILRTVSIEQPSASAIGFSSRSRRQHHSSNLLRPTSGGGFAIKSDPRFASLLNAWLICSFVQHRSSPEDQRLGMISCNAPAAPYRGLSLPTPPAVAEQRLTGAALRSLRKQRELDQKDIAEAIGIKTQAWSQYETGARPIPEERLAQ